MIPEESRFESDPTALVTLPPALRGWRVDVPDGTSEDDVAAMTALLRDREERGRGWAGSTAEDVLVEVSEQGLRMRTSLVLRDPSGALRAWGRVHDRAQGRMLFRVLVDRDLPGGEADACAELICGWGEAQARLLGAARGLAVQQMDSGVFAGDEQQTRWLAAGGFRKVRSWWQMNRPVTPDEASLVPDPHHWESDGVVFRRVRRAGGGMPEETDLREVHEVLEGAFADHFNGREETFAEFLHRLREDPGHRWDHWWLAELTPDAEGVAVEDRQAVGALVGTVSESDDGPDGSYVSYIGVLEAARGRGVAKGLLCTIIADAAARGRDRVGLEVDADSPTGADGLYVSMGWKTKYVTESWHRDVPVG